MNETTGPSEAQGEANADAPLHMTDGKPPGLGRPRAKHGRERRDRRRPLNSAADRADGEHIEQGPPQEGKKCMPYYVDCTLCAPLCEKLWYNGTLMLSGSSCWQPSITLVK